MTTYETWTNGMRNGDPVEYPAALAEQAAQPGGSVLMRVPGLLGMACDEVLILVRGTDDQPATEAPQFRATLTQIGETVREFDCLTEPVVDRETLPGEWLPGDDQPPRRGPGDTVYRLDCTENWKRVGYVVRLGGGAVLTWRNVG